MVVRCHYDTYGVCDTCHRWSKWPHVYRECVASPPPCLAGTHLKLMLQRLGIQAKADGQCPCNYHAKQMDAWGCDECERRIDEIVGWLREEADKRGLPFLDAAGRMLVRRAIKNARRAAES